MEGRRSRRRSSSETIMMMDAGDGPSACPPVRRLRPLSPVSSAPSSRSSFALRPTRRRRRRRRTQTKGPTVFKEARGRNRAAAATAICELGSDDTRCEGYVG